MNKPKYQRGDRVMICTNLVESTVSHFEGHIGEVVGSDFEHDGIYYQVELEHGGKPVKLDFLEKWLRPITNTPAIAVLDEDDF